MVRILCFVSLAAIVSACAYFLLKGDAKKRTWIVIGGGLLAAAAGIFMQSAFPIHLSLLGIIAVSLLISLSYTKMLEKENLNNQQLTVWRKPTENMEQTRMVETEERTVFEKGIAKPFGMQTINVVKEEQKVGQ